MRGLRPPSDWKKTMSEKIKHTKSSGNVFQDLGVKDSGLHQIKADLGIMLIDLIREKELTQTKAAALLGIRQPELSRLKGGNLSHYSVERLLGFLNRLNQRVEIKVKPSTRMKSAETVLAK
jgi:predicted XRE-type DNA-binding protein